VRRLYRVADLGQVLGVVTGNLVDLEVDAIVSETDTALRLVTGTSVALRVRCGPEFEQHAAALGPIGLGETAVVHGGRVWARSIILCAVFGPNAPPTEGVVRRCLSGALARVEEEMAESVAIPLLGAGPGGVRPDWCANATAQLVAERMQSGFFPRRAVLVAHDRATHHLIEEAVANVLRG
jgi:O-acetyl-ADP-ribose deacetylase (regulator of RNase III)